MRSISRNQTSSFFSSLPLLIATILSVILSQSALALITGGEGNEQELKVAGWPEGAAEIANNKARIAWWEGPPFGGGQYHIEYRGDAKALNVILAKFAELKSNNKEIVIHDGFVNSFWLNPNRSPEKKINTAMDFRFMVWSRDNWDRLRQMPADYSPVAGADEKKGPLTRIDIYAGGKIRMQDVKLPEGIKVVDNRLEAHGFSQADGVVYEGMITDLATNKPMAAELLVQLSTRQETGRYEYKTFSKTQADQSGRFVFKNMPEGRHRIVAEADGFVSRIVGHAQSDAVPRRHWFESGLSRPAVVSGKVVDSEQKPLSDATIRLSGVTYEKAHRYQTPVAYMTETNESGEFRFENVPIGDTSARASKVGFVRPGLAEKFSTPKTDIVIEMMKSAFVRVTVDFKDKKRPKNYIVSIEPEGGSVVGSWGGSGKIDENNERIFKNVPPGRYVIHGHPNPTREADRTDKVTIELKGGKTKKVTLIAK